MARPLRAMLMTTILNRRAAKVNWQTVSEMYI